MNRERIIAIMRLCIMLISAIASGLGLVINTDSLFTVVACIVAFVACIWSWWKNNNITEAAQEAQLFLEAAKNAVECVDCEISDEKEE